MLDRFAMPSLITLLSLLAMLASGFAMGWSINGLRWKTKFTALEKTHAEAAAKQSSAITKAIEQVRELERQGDAIAARIIQAEAAHQQLAKERDDAIKKLTAGKPCLAAPVVRLLNDAASPGAGLRLPPASNSSADADSAATAHPTLFASDTDVALWAVNARAAHDACRARIDALRTFYALEPAK